MTEGSLRVYDVGLENPVRFFYEEAWRDTQETRKIFEVIGGQLTRYALSNVSLLDGRREVYIAPVLRAGAGLVRPSVVEILQESGIPFEGFVIGSSRPHRDTDILPAQVYFNTLEYTKPDLNDTVVVLYEMGEATGSTIVGIYENLKKYGLKPEHMVLLAGAICLNQSHQRLLSNIPRMTIVAGSRWMYVEEGPEEFYLKWMHNPTTGEYEEMNPRDWGTCIFGESNMGNAREFISWMEEPMRAMRVSIRPKDREMLFERWGR